ncbi:MAG: calcium-translocating P-type ATPase, PMCA-type [Chitinispirillales bacterium]|jgi:Ca2+-transporting ATPase|nr:calcium-translocating P-type ATPase, PMCA-type [Chitinispirillales bacterium]
MNYFIESKETLFKKFKTDPQKGLTDSQANQNTLEYGANVLSATPTPSLTRRVMEACGEPMIIMLILAAVIAVAVNIILYTNNGEANFLECVGIFAAISISVVISIVMEGRSAKAFETLTKITGETAIKVIRNGRTTLISQKEIAVGDIVIVETGDKIPADGRLIESISLHADESSLTGESVPVKKNSAFTPDGENTPVAEQFNMLYSGCFITNGSGKMVVTGVGYSTEFGKIAAELSKTEKTSTPLQEKLGKLGKTIALFGTAAAAIAFLVQLFLFIKSGTATLGNVAEAFITSIVLIVAAVPEGLPTIVAISLAINIIKMSKQNALVKKMVACETVGSINVICSDKTGTLTENRMTVVSVYNGKTIIEPQKLKSGLLLDNFCINASANVNFNENEIKFIGSPTEGALLIAAKTAGYDYINIRSNHKIKHVFPFSSENKNMTTVADISGELTALSKGSPEKILSQCNLTESQTNEITKQITGFQEKACRVIAFSHKKISVNNDNESDYDSIRCEIESEMIFDGFAAITDPLRKDVYDAVKNCRSAGIDLKILTGDNIVTAKAIANELNLLSEDHLAVEAGDLEHLSDEELTERLTKIRIIARSAPVVKMRVVNLLKADGNVTAVTGDGINDAPAIKNADVGIAMGITGTEVSKEAADIVLLDDSFSTIVKAVKWGRGIYENFQRFICFQLTANLSSVTVVLSSIFAGLGAPFTAMQLLWVNIIMDGPPALTLGLEPIRDDLMKRLPTKRNSSIISKKILSKIALSGFFISAVVMLQWRLNFLKADAGEESTVLFTLFVLFQLFNAFNSRELTDGSIFRNIHRNKLMLLVVGITFGAHVFIIQFAGAFFRTVPLQFNMWIKITSLAFTVILAAEIFKLIKRIFRST